MIRKIALAAGSAAIMLGSAVPALAFNLDPNTTTEVNVAVVKNTSVASSNTGGNTQYNDATVQKAYLGGKVTVDNSNNVDTGNATTSSRAVVMANNGRSAAPATSTFRSTETKKVNVALVKNTAVADSDTGSNHQGNEATVQKGFVKGDVKVGNENTATTGRASSTSRALTVVNSRVAR